MIDNMNIKAEHNQQPPHSTMARINAERARSWLLVNAAQTQNYDSYAKSSSDAVVLDIEDSVAPKDKAKARKSVIDWLSKGNHAWVRINGHSTQWWAEDVAQLQDVKTLSGVMLAMTESVEQIEETLKALPQTKIVALIETAKGIEAIEEIAKTNGTFRLAFGVGDFRRDTGFGEQPGTLAYVRSKFTIASRSAGLPGPIDGPTISMTSLKVAEGTAISAEFGMTGKICLHPTQCDVVNIGLSPTVEDIQWAQEFLTKFNSEGGQIRNGSDLPRIARANKILELAKIFNIDTTKSEPAYLPSSSNT